MPYFPFQEASNMSSQMICTSGQMQAWDILRGIAMLEGQEDHKNFTSKGNIAVTACVDLKSWSSCRGVGSCKQGARISQDAETQRSAVQMQCNLRLVR